MTATDKTITEITPGVWNMFGQFTESYRPGCFIGMPTDWNPIGKAEFGFVVLENTWTEIIRDGRKLYHREVCKARVFKNGNEIMETPTK